MNLNKALELTIQARNDFRATYELEELIKNEMAAEINRSKGTYKPYSTLKDDSKSIKTIPMRGFTVSGCKMVNNTSVTVLA